MVTKNNPDTLPAWEKAPGHLGCLEIESQQLGRKYFTNMQAIFLDETNPGNISRHHLRPHKKDRAKQLHHSQV